MKKKVVLKESDIRKIIANVLSENIDEISYNTLDSASNKINRGWYDDPEYREGYHNIDDVFDAIAIIRQFLNRMEQSYTPLHGQKALNYFYDNKKAPQEGGARKCNQYLDFIERFVQRKQAQGKNLENAADSKEEQEKSELLKLAYEWNGFKGDSIFDFINTLNTSDFDDEWNTEWDRFVNSIQDPDLKRYAEENF